MASIHSYGGIPKALYLIALVLTMPQSVFGACGASQDSLYSVFKSYRQILNTDHQIDDLKLYFSTNFNEYYQTKLLATQTDSTYKRFLTQYWDNLNTARDIVIVFDEHELCRKNTARLELVTTLDTGTRDPASSNGADDGANVQLWRVRIYFVREAGHWKIDSFEYRKIHAAGKYLASDIIDNFVLIR